MKGLKLSALIIMIMLPVVAASEGMQTTHPLDYAPLEQDPRNSYLPPRYIVERLESDTEAAWQKIAPISLLTDMHGEELPHYSADIRIAWDDEHIYLRARVIGARQHRMLNGIVEGPEAHLPQDEDLQQDLPEHEYEVAQTHVLPDVSEKRGDLFWRQDHIEFRLRTNPQDQHDQHQFILAPDGRVFSSKGLDERNGLASWAETDETGWSAGMRIRFDAIDLPAPQAGLVLSGFTAFCKWEGPTLHTACISATELNFSQAERFAEFVLQSDPNPVQLRTLDFSDRIFRLATNKATVMLENLTGETISGRLVVHREKGNSTPGEKRFYNVVLPPGQTLLDVPIILDRPQFNRYTFRFAHDSLARELAALSLRAGVPPLDLDSLNLRRPRLLFTEASRLELMRKLKNPAFSGMIGGIDVVRDADIDLERQLHGRDRGDYSYTLISRAAGLAPKFAVTQDKRLVDVANELIKTALKESVPQTYTNLRPGMASQNMAIAYDTFRDHLTEEDAGTWLELASQFLQMHINSGRDRHWKVTTTANANAVCNGGGGFIALALLGEHPDAVESLYYARKLIRQHIEYSHGPDGGYTEGPQYWQYGGTNFLRFVYAMENVLGTDDGLFSHPHFVNSMNMIKATLCNDGKLSGINNTIPLPMGTEIAYFHAGRFNDPFALWYADHSVRLYAEMRARGRRVPYSVSGTFPMLFRPNVPQIAEQPPLPLVKLLEDIQIAIMRSSANFDCVFTAGFKGSRPPYTHHNNADTGSFYIDLRGERLMIDPGYYRGAAQYHSLPIINGVAPLKPHDFTGRIFAAESSGDIRYLAIDSTRAYRGAADRVNRHMVMVGETGIILLDDIAVPEGGSVLAQYQPGGVTEEIGEGRAVMVQGENAKLAFYLLSTPDMRLELKPEQGFPGWGYGFSECRWFPVEGVYEINETDPLVTVFIDATQGVYETPTVDKSGNEISITLPGGRRVFFAFHNAQWTLDRHKSMQNQETR